MAAAVLTPRPVSTGEKNLIKTRSINNVTLVTLLQRLKPGTAARDDGLRGGSRGGAGRGGSNFYTPTRRRGRVAAAARRHGRHGSRAFAVVPINPVLIAPTALFRFSFAKLLATLARGQGTRHGRRRVRRGRRRRRRTCVRVPSGGGRSGHELGGEEGRAVARGRAHLPYAAVAETYGRNSYPTAAAAAAAAARGCSTGSSRCCCPTRAPPQRVLRA